VGWYSLFSVDTNSFNTGIGAGALALNNADSNTAVGTAAMLLNTSGFENVANGSNALLNNASGSYNDAVGTFALLNNIDGSFNNAFGNGALSQNVHGSDNTAIGDLALANNDVTGNNLAYFNTAVGAQTLFSNTDGNSNTAIGWQALYFNDAGSFNTANGGFTLFSNIEGGSNTATGYAALSANTSGNANTAIGFEALLNNSNGSSNIAIGSDAGSNVFTANNVTCIGANVGGADVNNTTWIGNVYGVTTQSGMTAPVIVSDTGQLGTVASSERFKKDIATMDNVSEAILSLRPVTFHYNADTKGTPQFGLIAEEVAKVNPALVLPDKEGKPFTVRYEAVNAMLLNEFLKEHRKVKKLEANAARQQKQIEALMADLETEVAIFDRRKSCRRCSGACVRHRNQIQRRLTQTPLQR
jgi:hypothetical protein